MAFHEIIRQVSSNNTEMITRNYMLIDTRPSPFIKSTGKVWVHCQERGVLMEKIWNRYLKLFEHILRMREHERDQYNQSE